MHTDHTPLQANNKQIRLKCFTRSVHRFTSSPLTPRSISFVYRIYFLLSPLSCVMCMWAWKITCIRLISTDRDSAADLSFATCALSRRFIAAASAPTRSVQSRTSACKLAFLRLAVLLRESPLQGWVTAAVSHVSRFKRGFAT